jgi:hypothetical protein
VIVSSFYSFSCLQWTLLLLLLLYCESVGSFSLPTIRRGGVRDDRSDYQSFFQFFFLLVFHSLIFSQQKTSSSLALSRFSSSFFMAPFGTDRRRRFGFRTRKETGKKEKKRKEDSFLPMGCNIAGLLLERERSI